MRKQTVEKYLKDTNTSATDGLIDFIVSYANDNAVETGSDINFLQDNIDFIINNYYVSHQSVVDKCIEDEFNLDHFIGDTSVTVNSAKLKNLQKVYDTILRPIASYFKELYNVDSACLLKINYGVLSASNVNTLTGGNPSTALLVSGAGVDFSIIGVEDNDVLSHIVNSNIDIDFGLVCRGTGVYITLPITMEDHQVSKLYVYSVDGTRNHISHKFIQ